MKNADSGYAALVRAERYPELPYIDSDLLDAWRRQWGPDPDGWNVRAIVETQLIRTIRELTKEMRHNR